MAFFRVNFRLPKKILKDVDDLVKEGRFESRAEFFYTATVQLLKKEQLNSVAKLKGD